MKYTNFSPEFQVSCLVWSYVHKFSSDNMAERDRDESWPMTRDDSDDFRKWLSFSFYLI